jgi:cell wall assembly regulator SMI1
MVEVAENLWRQIIARGTQNDPEFETNLNLLPGASEEDFKLLENKLGVKLPEEMKAIYRVHNGQVWDVKSECFARNLTLTPISKIIEDWEFLNDEFDPDDLEPEIEPEIKPFMWNPKWIPFAYNGAGDYVCLDTDPSEIGVSGQVVYYFHDWGSREVEGNDLFEFIEICLEEED